MSSTRTQVYLTEDQRRRLDEVTRREGRSLASVIRDALDDYLDDQSADPGAALDATFGAAKGLSVPSRDEWQRG
jgi:predicted transcriptional regulator